VLDPSVVGGARPERLNEIRMDLGAVRSQRGAASHGDRWKGKQGVHPVMNGRA
jgi:hypothetical protein